MKALGDVKGKTLHEYQRYKLGKLRKEGAKITLNRKWGYLFPVVKCLGSKSV